MNADHHFTIGAGHRVCQDYAMSGQSAVIQAPMVDQAVSRTYAVVSDGCSSSPHTDWGSRFLCRAAEVCVATYSNMFALYQSVLDIAVPWTLPNYMHPRCLDATLMTAFQLNSKTVRVVVAGDGMVAARDRDGKIHAWDIQFNANAPGYLNYKRDLDRLHRYMDGILNERRIEGGCGHRTVTHYIEGVGQLDADLQPEVEKSSIRLVQKDDDTFEMHGFIWSIDLPVEQFDIVAVMSDGVHTFREEYERKRFKEVPFTTILPHLMGIKGTGGLFLERRLRKFHSRTCVPNKWTHVDDFSMAAIYTGERT